MKPVLIVLALCFAAASAYAEQGQVYKWTDAGGVVHYSDAPPPKDVTNVQTVKVSGGDRPHAVSMDSAEPGQQPKDASAGNGGTQSTVMPDTTSNRVKACATAHSNLELLNSKFPVTVAGSDGKAQALDDKQRQAQIADAQAQINLYCK
jgi:Domain of unknown function (DUF4124)